MIISGKLVDVSRYDTSTVGNPRYKCIILHNDDVTEFYTGVDSSHGYSITNYRDKLVTVELQYKRNKLTLQTIKGE